LSSPGPGPPGCESTPTSWSFAAPVAARRRRSIARLRAVVVSQAPGVRGTPSRRHRSSASVKASCAHSSARSQSPVTRMSVATTRPHSSRKARATAASTSSPSPIARSHLPDRAHLDRPVRGGRDPRRDLDGVVEVLRVDEEEPADLLLRLREGAVRREHLAVANPDGRGGRRGAQPLTAPQDVTELLHERLVLGARARRTL